jgi:hypothetical protein
MSVRYTIENLKKMRESAGLGVLSMGVCAISGELVGSTPIPGSRCGHVAQDPAEYGGYLLGEGMTREAALYLANLHNWFPALAEAVNSHSFECLGCGKAVEVAGIRCTECKDGGRDGDASYLEAIGKITEKHGWNIFEGPLGVWIDEHLVDIPAAQAVEQANALREQLDAATARAEAVEKLLHSLEFVAAKTVELHKQGLLGEPGDSRQIDNLAALLPLNVEVDDGMPF